MKLTELQQVINECIQEVLSEADVVPINKKNEVMLSKNQALNAWNKLLYLMDNVKLAMKYRRSDNKKRITNKDVYNIIDYINNSIDGIIKDHL